MSKEKAFDIVLDELFGSCFIFAVTYQLHIYTDFVKQILQKQYPQELLCNRILYL